MSCCRVQLKSDGTRWRTEGKWRGNWRMEWVASTLHTTSEHCVSSITTADAHTSAASSRLNWLPCRFKWTRPFRRKTVWFLRVCNHISNAVYWRGFQMHVCIEVQDIRSINAHSWIIRHTDMRTSFNRLRRIEYPPPEFYIRRTYNFQTPHYRKYIFRGCHIHLVWDNDLTFSPNFFSENHPDGNKQLNTLQLGLAFSQVRPFA